MTATLFVPQPGQRVQVRRTVNGELVVIATGTVAIYCQVDNGHYLELTRADNRDHDGSWHIGTTRGRITEQTVVTTVELIDA